MEVESKKYAETLLKMEKFHNLKYRDNQHAKLNTFKGVMRSKELSLATPEEIETSFKKQGIKEYRRVTIRRNDKTIQIHTYILTFEKPSMPREIRISYMTKMSIKTVLQPPYSSDLVPCDFWLLPKLRGCRYETNEAIKEAVTKVIDSLTKENFHVAF